jgi:hypothetical protein
MSRQRTVTWVKGNSLRVGLLLTLAVMTVVLFYTPFSGASASPALLQASPTPSAAIIAD